MEKAIERRRALLFFLLIVLIMSTGLISSLACGGVSERAGPLDPNTIPKYTEELFIPPVYQPAETSCVVTDGNGNQRSQRCQEYTVTMERFDKQILPSGFPQTEVFGYGGIIQTDGEPVYYHGSPGATFEATRGVPAKVHYVNNLTGSSMFAIDPTIHWADPNGMGTPASPFQPFPPGYAKAQDPIPAVVHLHGGEVESFADGGPEMWYTASGLSGPDAPDFDPGTEDTVTNLYPNSQLPTTLWYHDHALGITRINVMSGLVGFYLLRDNEDKVAQYLPGDNYEVPIVIQDRSFNTDGSLRFPGEGNDPAIHPYWQPNFNGDSIMVNGRTWPNFNVERRQYRLRLLNGSNARFYNLRFSNGMSFTQIGTGGGYLAEPLNMNAILLAPAERADILVDFSGVAPGTRIIMTNDANSPYPNGNPVDPATTGQIMQFTVGDGPSVAPEPLPPTLSTITPLRADSPSRTLTLNNTLSPANQPLEMLIDGQKWAAATSELPRVGATEDWKFVNMTADTHPIHIHLVQFQVVSRQPYDSNSYYYDWLALNGGGPLPFDHPTASLDVGPYVTGPPILPDPNERGWKDTVRMNPGEVTTIRVRIAPQDAAVSEAAPGVNLFSFDPTAGPGYVYHCHILDHEDNEMMRRMEIAP